MSSISREIIDELINDGRVLDRVKVELYLPVALGLRRCAIVELPVALPNGLELVRQVDESCRDDYRLVVEEPDPVKKWPLIEALKNNLQKSFEGKVLSSPGYLALTYWEQRLGLRRHMVALRPTIREIYLYRSMGEWWTIRRLAQNRLRMRKVAIRNPKYKEIAAFPEEFVPGYLRSTGQLLGYPDCCVEAYIQDRVGNTVAEIRLSNQLHSLRDEGKNPEPHSFFTRDFYPCQPECQQARKNGLRFLQTLVNLDQRLGATYLKCLEENMAYVENYGTYVAQHIADFDQRLKETMSTP